MSNPFIEFLKTQKTGQSPSPAGNWLNGKLIEAAPGDITVEFTITKVMTNPVGTTHGGILALMADEVIGIATFSLYNEYHFTSVNLNVDFLSNAREGETVTAKAKVIRQGRNIINVDCHIYNKEGKLLVKASSNMGKTSMRVRSKESTTE